jgi:hypothetical protein
MPVSAAGIHGGGSKEGSRKMKNIFSLYVSNVVSVSMVRSSKGRLRCGHCPTMTVGEGTCNGVPGGANETEV